MKASKASILTVAIAVSALAVIFLRAQAKAPLLWPLPINEGCTSSFGEFRLSHFHVGVDMRTHQEEGWPVFAAGDGKVTRLRREPEGYGRVLYLDLDDGRTAVYGHLCRYSRELGLEKLLQEACAAKGSSFPGDLFLSPPVRVKRGDILAYSGQLGIGAPHLHFEVRRGDEACDPFKEGLELRKGMEAPQIIGLAFVPRDASGEVDGSFRPAYISAVSSGPDRYRMARAVSLSGAVDIMVAAKDHLGIPDNSTGVPQIEASLDGTRFFTMDLGCISFAKYKESTLLFDPDWTPGDVPAYRLRRAEGLGISGVTGDGLPAGVALGSHSLEVVASNRGGMYSVLEGEARFAEHRVLESLALPGSGYALKQVRILPAGVWLSLSRKDGAGVTPLVLDGHPVEGLMCEVRGNEVEALIPMEAISGRAGILKMGSVELPGRLASGPSAMKLGAWELELPAGAAALIQPDGKNSQSVKVLCGPFSLRGRALLAWKADITPGAHCGVFYNGRWAKKLDGKPFPLRGDGVYAIGEDHTAPRWDGLYIATFPHLGEREARLTVEDSGSGPDPYSLHVTLDGQTVYPDWHAAARQVRVDLTSVPPGRHVLAGRCSDRAGNWAVLAPVSFTLGKK